MTQAGPFARRREAGYVQSEFIWAVFIITALVLGLLLIVEQEDDPDVQGLDVPFYRSANADYINVSLLKWRSAVQNYHDLTGRLPGDDNSPLVRNSTGGLIGDNNGRVEREKEEHLKFGRDMQAAGLSSDPRIRVRGRFMDFFWFDPASQGARGKVGHYFRLAGAHSNEAKAYDYKVDDGDHYAGDVLFFGNPDGSVDLFVRFVPF